MLIIKHEQGTGYVWTKNPWYDASHNSLEKGGTLAWLSSPDIGPEVRWRIVIAVSYSSDPAASHDPPFAVRSYYSCEWTFYWYDDSAQVP
ncbi:MAG: hypothetical protein JW934_02745 [Anaerolineae bacterium]|nr:hypothetical protein [Anaerolineae bacterium]